MSPQFIAWGLLVVSIISEVMGTIALKYADGFTKPIPSLLVCLFYVTAVWLMALVVKHLDLSITYAVWAGCGTALTAVIGIWLFGETISTLKIAGLIMIIMGVVALNLSSASH